MAHLTRWPRSGWSVWAKSGDEMGWLSLPQHMIDSADIASILWEEWLAPAQRGLISGAFGWSEEAARRVVAWLVGSHDIGKADPKFLRQIEHQPKYTYLLDKIAAAGMPLETDSVFEKALPHSVLSHAVIADFLHRAKSAKPTSARTWASVSGAHHGLPVDPTAAGYAFRYLKTLDPRWRDMHRDLLESLADHTGAEGPLQRIAAVRLDPQAQMVITGLTIMTDWIASNADVCPMTSSGRSTAPDRARRAVDAIRLTSPWTPLAPNTGTPSGDFARRFSWPEDRTARPSQVAAVELCASLRSGQSAMLVIEAPMGEGKTEAALLGAEVLAERGGSSGVMVAAPTTATADGLLNRVTRWAQSTTTAARPVSLFLGHSRSRLNPEMRRLRFQGIGEDPVAERSVAHQWLSGRKKGILSNVVVGTVDQVLFMALQSRHVMLRHLGLSGKVVIIDEVHAYDTYMSSYLITALHWLGRYGSGVVLLSATLPASRRHDLMEAYRSGLEGKPLTAASAEVESRPDFSYPRLSLVTSSREETAAPAPAGASTSVQLSTIDDDEDALRRALHRTRDDGGCTAVICSTVSRAQDVYRIAQEMVGEEAALLHAQFTASHRLAAERRLLDELGPGASRGHGRPGRRIVVATQVIEQSLDLDFDLLITDIAPADLILQRMGRLHRHRRPAEDRPHWAQAPRTIIRGMSAPSPQTAPEFAAGIAYVYPEPLLLSSIEALGLIPGESTLSLPADIPRIVHAAYEAPQVPSAWSEHYAEQQRLWEESEDRSRLRARNFQLKAAHRGTLTSCFAGPSGSIDESDQIGEQMGLARVRDADPSIEVIPVCVHGESYTPLLIGQDAECPDPVPAGIPPSPAVEQLLAGSTLRLPGRFGDSQSRGPEQLDQLLDELEQQTDSAWMQSSLLRGQLMLRFNENLRTTLAEHELEYDADLGLIDHTHDVWRRQIRTDDGRAP